MSVRFKFRSAVNYDVVEIGEKRETISIRELKERIVEQKKLNICHDFDLLVSDAVSGREYHDDDFDIPRGASVIIKRVPAEKRHWAVVPVAKVENLPAKESCLLDPSGEELEDFGTQLCPLPAANFQHYDLASRDDERSRLQNLDSRNLFQDIPKGLQDMENERNLSQRPISEEQAKLERLKNQAAQSFDLPFELNCSLCHKVFKDAVMIPCCQNSFCEKCIKTVLLDKARCPRCSSDKCKIDHLLPNLSLRQAIEHFIENQMLADGSVNDLCKYVPDGESGIQANDTSCGVTVIRMEAELPHSPTATGKGSNQIISGSFNESLTRKNIYSGLDSRVKNFGGRTIDSATKGDARQIDKERGRYFHDVNIEAGFDDRAQGIDCQGESMPLNMPKLQDEADSTLRQKRGIWVDAGGGSHYKSPAGRQKGDRTCYMCGSPDHFIRDCPANSNGYPMVQTGNCMPRGPMLNYSSPHWNGAMLPPFSPYGNMYGTPGMMPYNLSMVPGPPFAMPTYVPPLYGGLPTPRASLGMGNNTALVEKRFEHRPIHLEPLDDIHLPKRAKLSNEINDRHFSGEDDFHDHSNYNKQETPVEYKLHGRRELTESYSQDSSSGRKRKKHQHGKCDDSYTTDGRQDKRSHFSPARRDHRVCPLERSNSRTEHKPDSADKRCEDRHRRHNEGPHFRTEHKPDGAANKHYEERHKRHNEGSNHHLERRGQSGSESSHSRHHSWKDMRRHEPDELVHRHKYNSHPDSNLESTSSGGGKHSTKERDSCHDSKPSKYGVKHTNDKRHDDKRQRAHNDADDYRHHKQKKLL